MDAGIRGSGGIVSTGHAVSLSASGRGISGVSMAFERRLCVSYDSRGLDQHICTSSNTVRNIWLYVQYEVCDFTGYAADISYCGSSG